MPKHGKPAAKKFTARDLEILQRIGEGGIASLTQIKNLYWPNAHERTAEDRLNQLKNAGLLEAHRLDQQICGQPVYTLTKKGASHFEKVLQQKFLIGLPAHHELKQQLLAQDARAVIEKQLTEQGAALVEWRGERELRSQAAKARSRSRPFGNIADIPDAAAVIESANGSTAELAIEIDGQYYGQMLKKKIAGIARSGQPCLWVTSGEGRGQRINAEVAQSGADNITVLVV